MSKTAELREQTDDQLDLLLKETQQNLFRLRLQSETERLEAPSEIIKAKARDRSHQDDPPPPRNRAGTIRRHGHHPITSETNR